MKKILAIFTIVLGFISGGLCFYAGKQLAVSAQLLTILSSRGGESVAEVYYQQIGHFGIAYSFLAYAVGTAIIMVGIGFGSILFSQSEK